MNIDEVEGVDEVDENKYNVMKISGTQQRDMLRKGEKIPEWFTFPAVETELKKLTSTKIIATYKDHRMAMSFAPLSLKFGELIIKDVEVVSKSYPNFWEDLQKGGFTIVPLSLYFTDKGFAKLSCGIAKGKKKIDKRESIKQRDWNIKKQRLLKNN